MLITPSWKEEDDWKKLPQERAGWCLGLDIRGRIKFNWTNSKFMHLRARGNLYYVVLEGLVYKGRETWLHLSLAKWFARSIGCLPEKHNCHPRIHERRRISSQSEVRLILLILSNTVGRSWTTLLRKLSYLEANRGSWGNWGMESCWSLPKTQIARQSKCTRIYKLMCEGS